MTLQKTSTEIRSTNFDTKKAYLKLKNICFIAN